MVMRNQSWHVNVPPDNPVETESDMFGHGKLE